MIENIVEELRQPEYTGENRCEACTAANVTIAGVLGVILSRRSKFAGVMVVGISLSLIYVRGYLIPGTPKLTKRYMPAPILRLFGKDPEADVRSGLSPNGGSELTDSSGGVAESPTEGSDTEGEDLDTLSPEEYFLSVGVIEECDGEDDLCIEETFESEWTEEMTMLNNGPFSAEDAAIAMGLDGENREFTIREDNQAHQLKRDQQVIGQWPSRAALIADVGASRVLESWDTHWTEYEPTEKGELLNALRLFLDACPTTEGEIVFKEETVESCCSSYEVIAAVCEETDERIFEHQLP
ncbi:hypothetical protein [Halorubrum sp. FL23]|uniref:hypothetical protein n=1 Tax=Halorubrum sp. FL23 TaxID=3458704 RepID=UPI004033BC5F